MRRLSLILLLSAALLLTACSSASKNTEQTTAGKDGTAETQTSSDTEGTEEPNGAIDPWDAMIQKYPIVSDLSGSFAESAPSEQIKAGFTRLEAMKSGVMEIKAAISMNLGVLGSQEEQISIKFTVTDDAFQSAISSTTLSDGESYSTAESDTYVDGVYYYLYQFKDGVNDYANQYKASLTAERFKDYISGGVTDEATGAFGALDDADLAQITALTEKAVRSESGMTENGGCVYIYQGFTVADLTSIDLLLDYVDDPSEYLTEDCAQNIVIALKLSKEGSLEAICIDLPLEISIESEGFSMNMAVALQIEAAVRGLSDTDRIEAPADSDAYIEVTEDQLFGSDETEYVA